MTISKLFSITIASMAALDKRRFTRKETTNLVFYKGNGIEGLGRVRNLSLKGALIETDKKPPPLFSHLHLDIGAEEFYGLTGKVVWIKRATFDKWYFGVEFDNLQEFPSLNIFKRFKF